MRLRLEVALAAQRAQALIVIDFYNAIMSVHNLSRRLRTHTRVSWNINYPRGNETLLKMDKGLWSSCVSEEV